MILPWRNVSVDGGVEILSSITGRETTRLQVLA
jgi:hypothetical protein